MVLTSSPTENEPSSPAVNGPPYWLTADVPPMRPSLNSAVMVKSLGSWLLIDQPVSFQDVPSRDGRGAAAVLVGARAAADGGGR